MIRTDFDPKMSECHTDDTELKERVRELLHNMDGRSIGIIKAMVDSAWDEAVDDAHAAMSQGVGDC